MARRFRNYPTGLVSNDFWYSPLPPYEGAGWRIALKERLSPAADELRDKRRRLPPKSRKHLVIGRELIVQAPNDHVARQAALALHAAYCLVNGFFIELFPGMSYRRAAPSGQEAPRTDFFPRNDEPTDVEDVLLDSKRGMILSMPRFTAASQIAAVASLTPKLGYALLKYYLSVQLVSIDPFELNARYGRHDFSPSSVLIDHVWFSQALFLAHGVIEELGLNVNASVGKEKKSYVGGQWDPDVKEHLAKRLAAAGISDPDRLCTMCFRGDTSELEKEMGPRRSQPNLWASESRRNRDREVPLIDAINWIGALRSKAAAHTLRQSAPELTPLDVFNAQTVARYLLLNAVGFWDEESEHEHIHNFPRGWSGKVIEPER